MQDFRRPPQNFYYIPEWCDQLKDEESWVECEDKMDCHYSHTLVEILFNPLHYKMHECPDRVPSDKFGCEEKKEICAFWHSVEEREMYQKSFQQGVPSRLPHNDGMEWYEE